jgi:hypothetical protein
LELEHQVAYVQQIEQLAAAVVDRYCNKLFILRQMQLSQLAQKELELPLIKLTVIAARILPSLKFQLAVAVAVNHKVALTMLQDPVAVELAQQLQKVAD